MIGGWTVKWRCGVGWTYQSRSGRFSDVEMHRLTESGRATETGDFLVISRVTKCVANILDNLNSKTATAVRLLLGHLCSCFSHFSEKLLLGEFRPLWGISRSLSLLPTLGQISQKSENLKYHRRYFFLLLIRIRKSHCR